MTTLGKGGAVATALAAALTMATPASATVIGFDDLSASDDPIANGYAGLQWSNLYVLDPSTAPTSGYKNAVVDGQQAAYSGFDDAAVIGGLSDELVLQSGWFTAAFNDGLTITAKGYKGDALLHELSFVVDTNGPTQQTFDWRGVTRVSFSGAGGKDRFFDMSGTNFAVDAVQVAAVPEPATWAMMVLGFAAAATALRRQRRRLALA